MFSDGDWVESKDQDPAGEYRLLQLADIGDGVFLDKSNRWMNSEQFSRLRCTSLNSRDILIARMPDPIARACIFPSNLPTCATVVDVAILRCGEGYIPEFVVLVINDSAFRAEAQSLLTGTTRQRISRSNLAKIVCKLPSPAEQRRIVDVVSSVDAYIDALQQQADTARTARNAVLHELLTAGGDDWTETTLGKTLEIARGGSPRPIRDFITTADDGINWIKIGDATASSKYIYHTEQKIRPEGATRSRVVKSGDFILSNSMSFGRPYIMRSDGCIHDGWLLFSKVDKYFDEDFLYNLLLSDLVQKQFDSLAAGSGVRNLNIEVVKEVIIPLPSLSTQKRIAQIANSMDDVIQATEQAVVDAKNLRSGMLSDLLSGNHEIPASYDSLLGAA